MRAELNIDTSDLEERITQRVIAALMPLLSGKADDELIDIDEAAAFLGKSKDQIYQWVNNAKHGLSDFPFLKAGRSLKFSKNKLQEWMMNNARKR